MATQGDKIKYRGYAYVKGKGGGGDIDEGKVKEIINTYIVQEEGSATDKLMSQDAVTKAIQDTDVGSLKARMTNAENNITTNANNINTNTLNITTNTNNITTNTTNIDLNKQSITLEQTARKAADNTLQTNIDNEATTRTEKDNELLGKININKGNIDIVNNSLTVLQDSFNTHKSEFDEAVRTINSTIATEQTTRQSKDSQLEAKITALEANVQVDVVDAEPPTPEENTLYFIKQDDNSYIRRMYSGGAWHDMGDTEIDLSNYYTKNETYTKEQIDDKIQVNTTDIASEKITRANADTTLLNNINTEVDNRENADTTLQTNIDNEVTARTNADNNLQTQITNNDTDIETNKTNIATNTTNITTNTTDIATLKTDKQDKTDDTLETTSHTVVGAINELNTNKQHKLTAGDWIKIDETVDPYKIKGDLTIKTIAEGDVSKYFKAASNRVQNMTGYIGKIGGLIIVELKFNFNPTSKATYGADEWFNLITPTSEFSGIEKKLNGAYVSLGGIINDTSTNGLHGAQFCQGAGGTMTVSFKQAITVDATTEWHAQVMFPAATSDIS